MAMSDYTTRQQLLTTLTSTHEKTVDDPVLGRILIRELTARQRLAANEAATAENAEMPDQALYWAMLLQSAIVDPSTGTPGPDGRVDPRTRAPLFSVEDVQTLADGRDLLLQRLVNHVTSLAALGIAELRSFRPEDVSEQRDQDAGNTTAGTGPEGDASEGTGDAHGGASPPDHAE